MITWCTMHGLCTLNIHGHLDFVQTHKKEMSHITDLLDSAYATHQDSTTFEINFLTMNLTL
jgi:hypothetical protein